MIAHSVTTDADPAFRPLFAPGESDDQSSHAHRQFIGVLGLVLPVLLWLISGVRPTKDLPQWELLGSISAYYYTGAVAAFVGLLCALGVFLFTYKGYKNDYSRRDRVAAIVASIAAILVAFFPTGAPNDSLKLSWWTAQTGVTHYTSAVILFCTFAFFSLILFPKSKDKSWGQLPFDKRVRNTIYVSCGIAIVSCMVWAGVAGVVEAQIFWPEALALEFFALSWLVKGRADWTAVAVGRRIWRLRQKQRG